MKKILDELIEQTETLPGGITTYVDILEWHARATPEKKAYIFLKGNTEVYLSYRQLRDRARAIAARLQQQSRPGERALLLYPSGLDYIAAFYGCLYAGIIAVPAYPPHQVRPERSLPRLQAIVQDARPVNVLTTMQAQDSLRPFLATLAPDSPLHWYSTDNDTASDRADAWVHPPITGSSIAFLQYTSGSTSTPRGAMISHANLLANEAMIKVAALSHARSIFVTWLPLYHDMGLIGNVLQTMYLGSTCVVMAPATFLQHPYRWLQAISSFQAEVSGGPNFAYDLCVRKITPAQRQHLDLSSWKLAFNGAEPIRSRTLEAFAHTFAANGFRRTSFFPCYGLAEATLLVTGQQSAHRPIQRSFCAPDLERHLVRVCTPTDAAQRVLVSSGSAYLDQRVVIVDPRTHQPCPQDRVGEIWVHGPNIACGYWNRREENAATFGATLANGQPGAFLRTGDLGFMQDGELFVTGRLKDLVILEGRNHYPQDIEQTVEHSHPALRPGGSAAFAVDIQERERLIVAVEVDPRAVRDSRQASRAFLATLTLHIKQAVQEQHDIAVDEVAILTMGTIPKTSSGKIRRSACCQAFLAHTLERVE